MEQTMYKAWQIWVFSLIKVQVTSITPTPEIQDPYWQNLWGSPSGSRDEDTRYGMKQQ
ncbi:MAG: hypothetical protein IPQ04_15445 [Saprospiraceae bacterium]|nr:hypothetical protein [Saprospiraceae bacterium]